MAEALFYHLTTQPLERALPDLLERTLARGWRALVRTGEPERVGFIDSMLWTYGDGSFLPHGTAESGAADRQPVYITAGTETPNDPNVLFLVDGADTADFAEFERIVVMFAAADQASVDLARAQWLRAAAGTSATYWKQGEDGRWIKSAESG